MYYPNDPSELLSPEEAKDCSGRELMDAILKGHHPGPAIARTLGFHLQEVDDGRVVFRGTPDLSVTNPMGSTHGGWYGTLLDSCMACAVLTKLPKGVGYTTLEFKVNILRAIPLGMTIDAIGVIDHVGRSTGVSHGEIRGVEDGRLYATGSTTCIVLQPK